MKKIFMFAAAVMASMSLMAGVNVITEQAQVINDGNWIITGPDNAASSQSSVIFPDTEMEPGFPTGKQSAANYFKMNGTSDLGAKLATTKRSTIKNLAEGDVITVYWFSTNTTKSTFVLSYAHTDGKGTKLYDSEETTPVAKTVYASVLPALTADDIEKISNAYEGTAGLGYISCNNSVYVYAIKIEVSCASPAEKLTLSADKTEDVYVGDVITFTTAGGNGSEIKIYDGEEEISSPWTATAGAHSFTAVQEANDGVCGAITEAIEINVASKNPVTSAVINGPTAAEAGDELTYTLEADNATVIAWYLDGELQEEETSATFVYTAVMGKHAIYATASNAYTDEPVKSNEIALVVSAALVNDTYIWKKGSGFTGCVENPNVDPNANQAETVLANSRCDISGASKMGRAETDNVEVSIQFTANEGLYIQEICTYGKLEEPAGAEISWDGNKWEHIDAYTETQKSFEAPASTYPTLFIIKFLGVSHSSGGIWWRNALLTLSTKPEGTGFESTEATIKATKVIRNGQMFILKNGVLYNMQGAVVK